MSAILSVYKNSSCLPEDELDLAGSDYDLLIGPTTGLDGDSGDMVVQTLYIKNTGDNPAVGIRFIKANDDLGSLEARIASTQFTKDVLSIGDLLPAQIVALYIKVTVPKGTLAALVTPNFTLKYRSLP